MGRCASPRGDHSTGTQDSPVGHRSQLVDVDRELGATDYVLEPEFTLEPTKSPTDKLASEQQVKPPLTSAVLPGMPHPAAEHDSGCRRFPFPCLGTPHPGLRSDLPGLSAPLPGLRLDLPDLSAPLPGRHVAPPRGQDGLPPRGQDGPPLSILFPGLMQEFSRMLISLILHSSPQDYSSFGLTRCA